MEGLAKGMKVDSTTEWFCCLGEIVSTGFLARHAVAAGCGAGGCTFVEVELDHCRRCLLGLCRGEGDPTC